MKKLIFAAFLALTGAGFFTQSAQAQLNYNDGDLLIGFRDTFNATTQSSDYVLDAGPISTILGYTQATVLPGLGSTGADLTSVFGADSAGWFASGDATWGVVGAQNVTSAHGNAVVLYAGSPNSIGSLDASYNPQAVTNQGNTQTTIDTGGNYYANSGTPVSGGSAGTSQSTSNTSSYGYLVTNGGAAFGQFSGFESAVPTVLNFYEIFPTSKNNQDGTPGTFYEGQFSIAGNGAITFTPASAAPEPSTLTALAGGAGLLGLIRRRRAVIA